MVAFLDYYCGIDLNNSDTGAITGFEAGIILEENSTDFYGNPIDIFALAEAYGDKASLFPYNGSSALYIGNPVLKTNTSVVPETFVNTYTATGDAAQEINTDNRDWIVNATEHNDTINSGGADLIKAGAGDDEINVNADNANITGGAGADKIQISAEVKNVTINDLKSEDEIIIQGTFEVGAVTVEDMTLIITDKTGTRKITLGEFTDAVDGKVNIGEASTTIGEWLTDSGIDITNLNFPAATSAETSDPAQITETSGDQVTVNLSEVDTSQAGYVEIGGQSVGQVSSDFPEGTTTFTRNGLTIHLLGHLKDSSELASDDNITPCTYNDLKDNEKAIIAGLFKWWFAEALNLNEESYGVGFNSDTTMTKEIGLVFYDNNKDGSLAAVGNWYQTADG